VIGQRGKALYGVDEIAASYDAQAAESYRAKEDNPDFFELYGRAVGAELAKLKPSSVLDAGCGDGVTLHWAVRELPFECTVNGIDASSKRLKIARKTIGARVFFVQGQLGSILFRDERFDVVFTSHAMEPNGGDEVTILTELARVARRYVVLFEPDYNAASLEGRARMRRLNYVANIRGAIKEVGLTVEKDEPFSVVGNALNPTGLWVLSK